MSKKNNRFIRILREYYGISETNEIWVDRETGVNYICQKNGNGIGITPLLGSDGKPVVSSVSDYEDNI